MGHDTYVVMSVLSWFMSSGMGSRRAARWRFRERLERRDDDRRAGRAERAEQRGVVRIGVVAVVVVVAGVLMKAIVRDSEV